MELPSSGQTCDQITFCKCNCTTMTSIAYSLMSFDKILCSI